MTITEKAAYLKGLVEGKGLDPEAGEGKLWHVLAELAGDMAAELAALRKDHEQLSDSMEEVEVSLDYLEELLQEDYEDFDDEEEDDGEEDYYPFGRGNFRIVDDEEEEEDEEEPDDSDDGVFYEVECPNCGEEISFDDETLDEGSIQCPNCGATLEFGMRSGEEKTDLPEETAPEDGDDKA